MVGMGISTLGIETVEYLYIRSTTFIFQDRCLQSNKLNPDIWNEISSNIFSG